MGASQSAEPQTKKAKPEPTPSRPMPGSEVVGSAAGRQVTREEHRVRAAEAAARRAGAGRSLGSTIALELAIQVDSEAARRLREVGLSSDGILPRAVDMVDQPVGTKRQRDE